MLTLSDTGLILIDVQGKLATLVANSNETLGAVSTLIQGSQLLGLPVIWVEQLPDKLGATLPAVAAHLSGCEPYAKSTFSALGNSVISQAIASTGRKDWLVCGIEAHICVYQTVCDLLENGYNAHVVSDAVSSRNPEHKALALDKMQRSGAVLTCVEMALYELLQRADIPEFKAILPLVK